MRLFVNQLREQRIYAMWCRRRSLPTYGGFLLGEGWFRLLGLSLFVERAPVALDAGLELGELAVGGALGSARHLSAGGEPYEGLAHSEGFGGVVPVFVDQGEPFVGVAADELLAEAGLVEFD